MQDTVPVSVVIPCFRCAATIGYAVASVAQQVRKPAEVILVDDASGDGTWAALQQLAHSHPGWVKLLHLEENRGAASARNAGWTVATQPYIAFLDADDSWHAGKLNIQYEYMKSHPNVWLCGHPCVEFGKDIAPSSWPAPPVSATRVTATGMLFKTAFSTPSVMLRRDLPYRFQEGKRYAEDALLWQQVAFSGLGIVCLRAPLAYLHKARYGAGGLSSEMWAMERGELANLVEHYKAGKIGIPLLLLAGMFSLIKYARREGMLGINKMLHPRWRPQ